MTFSSSCAVPDPSLQLLTRLSFWTTPLIQVREKDDLGPDPLSFAMLQTTQSLQSLARFSFWTTPLIGSWALDTSESFDGFTT